MSLSVYSKDIRNINDNIDIINDKQRKINDTITMIESSINKIKNNCFGSTASVICIRLNNLKSELLNTNSDLSTYKQQSQIVVDNFNQGCLGLDLDEVVLKNNLNLLNDKLETYQSLSLPNNALVENTNEMINRNQDLLYRLNNFETNTYDKLNINDTEISRDTSSKLEDSISTFIDSLNYSLSFAISIFQDLDDYFIRCSENIKFWTRLGKGVSYTLSYISIVPDIVQYDWKGNFFGSLFKSGFDIVETGLITWGSMAIGSAASAKIGAIVGTAIPIPGMTVVGCIIGGFVGAGIDWILNQDIIEGKSINDWFHEGCDWLGNWVGSWFD